jgi:protoporphyrinogen oxidase
MWEACRDSVTAGGHAVLMGQTVVRIDHHQGRVTAVHTGVAAEQRLFEADHVISTMPIRSLVRALSPAAPPAVRQAADGLRYRDFIVVALILDKEHLFPDNWIYVHTPGVQVGRIQNFNNWSAAMVPVPGATCLGMEYFCFEGDGLWERPDPELIAQASRELEQLGLARATDIVDGTVIRVPKAYPIYDHTYRQRLGVIRDYIDPIANLHTVGRNGMHKYNNQDHSMLAAMLAVANMQGGTYNIWDVNTDFDYHESQAVQHGGGKQAA